MELPAKRTINGFRPKAAVAVRAKAESSDQRRSPRKASCSSGVIAIDGRRTSLLCTVRDMSATGARLHIYMSTWQSFSVETGVPQTFTLMVETDRVEVDCAVAWRRQNEIGVRFVSPFRTMRPAPQRTPPTPVKRK